MNLLEHSIWRHRVNVQTKNDRKMETISTQTLKK